MFATKQAQPFIVIARWLRDTTTPPDVAVLENADGLAKGRDDDPAPLQFVLRGEMVADDGTIEEIGLELIKRCHVFVLRVKSRS